MRVIADLKKKNFDRNFFFACPPGTHRSPASFRRARGVIYLMLSDATIDEIIPF